MVSRAYGDPEGWVSVQNKWDKKIEMPLSPDEAVISESTYELFDDLCNNLEQFRHPILPIRPSLPTSRKRDRDELPAYSSDAPLFSSDDLPSSSADNYLEKRRKRQHQRSWFEDENASNIAKSDAASIAKGSSVPRSRGPFKRAYDSGVWMGSDDTLGEGGLDIDEISTQLVKEVEEDGSANDEGESNDVLDGDTSLAHSPIRLRRSDLLAKAVRTTEDPGDLEGPIFPYWQKQPDNLEAFHTLQRAAQQKVHECVEKGGEDFDLSGMQLEQIRTATLRPLRFHTKQSRLEGIPSSFQTLTPDLCLYLSNNLLNDVPGEVYHLKNLKVLSLRSNNLSEILPAISRLANLNELNLGSNQLRWLPWELLSHVETANSHVQASSMYPIEKLTIHPNPFLKPVPSFRNLDHWEKKNVEERRGHLASTRIAFLDITGSSLRDYAQAPSSVPEHWETSSESRNSVYPPAEKRTKTPSLMELAVRACYNSPQLSQLPFLLPPDCPAYIIQFLESAWKLKESGGQCCSVCRDEYVIPRTEWLEWWYCSPINDCSRKRWLHNKIYRDRPVPFLRRGCSWQCFEESVDVEIRGWSSSIAPGGRDEEAPMASLRGQI